MHRPPLSKERTGGDHFGERNLWRVEKTNISPPSKHQPQGDTFEESTFHHTPQFVTKTREFSTYPSSGLCWRDTQHAEGPQTTYFQVSVAAQSQCPPGGSDHRPEDGALLHLLSPGVRVPARLRKAAHPTRLGHIFCWSCDHRKPRINCLSPSCIVAPKKCI